MLHAPVAYTLTGSFGPCQIIVSSKLSTTERNLRVRVHIISNGQVRGHLSTHHPASNIKVVNSHILGGSGFNTGLGLVGQNVIYTS